MVLGELLGQQAAPREEEHRVDDGVLRGVLPEVLEEGPAGPGVFLKEVTEVVPEVVVQAGQEARTRRAADVILADVRKCLLGPARLHHSDNGGRGSHLVVARQTGVLRRGVTGEKGMPSRMTTASLTGSEGGRGRSAAGW